MQSCVDLWIMEERQGIFLEWGRRVITDVIPNIIPEI